MALHVPLHSRILLQCMTLGFVDRWLDRRDPYSSYNAYQRAVLSLYDRMHDSHIRSQSRNRPSGFLSRGVLPHLPRIPNPFASGTQHAANHQAAAVPRPPQNQRYQVADVSRFSPNISYSDQDLIDFASLGQYDKEDEIILLFALSAILESPQRSRENRYMAGIQIAKLLGPGQTIYLHGADHQADYFASYAIDLMLQEMDSTFSPVIEQLFRETLNLLINELSPQNEKFVLDGIVRTRQELFEILFDPHFFDGAGTSAAWRNTLAMEAELRTSNVESVSTRVVRDNSAKILAIMESKTPIHYQRDLATTVQEFKTKAEDFLNRINKQHDTCLYKLNPKSSHYQERLDVEERAYQRKLNKHQNALAGLEIVATNNSRDDNWSVNRSPSSILPSVWSYIKATQDSSLKAHLYTSLFNKLIEIKVENPCPVGQLQRLLDVATALDPDMDQFGADAQLGEELCAIAGKVNERFDMMIEEDAKLTQLRHEQQQASPIGRLGVEIFRQTVEQDVGRFRGINVRKLETDIQRLEEGFKPLS